MTMVRHFRVMIIAVSIGIFGAAACQASPREGIVTVNMALRSAKAIVYELPQAEGRDEAIRYITELRDSRFREKEILDAGALDERTLKSKLKDGFVLYTTLDDNSRLLRLCTEGMNWKYSNNQFVWNDIVAPAEDLRIIMAGKNPYSDGPCAIYAAPGNRQLIQINSAFHGPDSYTIYQGKTLVKKGLYDTRFTPNDDQQITLDHARDDIDEFFVTVKRVHPDAFATLGKKGVAALQRAAVKEAEDGADSASMLGIEDLAYILYRSAAAFEDGHTTIRWQCTPSQSVKHDIRYPAYHLGLDNGRFRVVAAEDQSLLGSDLVAINGIPIHEFLQPVLERCSGETLAYRSSRFVSNQPFWNYFTKLFEGQNSCTLRVRDKMGEERDAVIRTLGFSEYQNFLETMREPHNEKTEVQFFDGDIALLIYRSFRLNDREKNTILDIFEQISDKKSKELIIDLRGNGGGNSLMGDYLFSFIYGGKFGQFSKVRQSQMRLGLVKTYYPSEQTYDRPDAFFDGRIWLLVDSGTFSSAANFAAMFRDYGVGKIIGCETGGVPVSFGDTNTFYLKYSGIQCDVSYKQFFCPKPRPGDDEHGVLPDLPATAELLAGFRGENDPILAYALSHIREGRQ